MQRQVQAVVLAAGRSSRLGTGYNKQIAPLCGMPMVGHVLNALAPVAALATVVVGHQGEDVTEAITALTLPLPVRFVYQTVLNGTGGAVKASDETWEHELMVIVNGDMPLITTQALKDVLDAHRRAQNDLTFCITECSTPTGYGRVIIRGSGRYEIREERECSVEERSITAVNGGIYVCSRALLTAGLAHLMPSSTTGEYYITDLIALASERGYRVGTVHVPLSSLWGVNTLSELARAENILYERKRHALLAAGVRLCSPDTISIDVGVSIGAGSVIEPGVAIRGASRLEEGVHVGAYTQLENVSVAAGARILAHTVIRGAVVGERAQVGPFAHIRPGVTLGADVVIGNFVEVKQSVIGVGSKIKHHSYIGDTHVGAGVNIGAGTITCNYDGYEKHQTIIGDGAFVGAHTSLVAPCVVGGESYIGAGSVITKEVPARALALSRSPQVIREEWRVRRAARIAARLKNA